MKNRDKLQNFKIIKKHNHIHEKINHTCQRRADK